MSVQPARTSRGRPRDPAIDAAILRATLGLLTEHGYGGLRVQDVAERAQSGLGAIYRRWPTKRDLALAALRSAAPDYDLPTTEDPLADVLAGLTAMAVALAGPRGRLLSGVLAELPTDAEFALAVRETLIAPLRTGHRERLRRLMDDAADVEARADIGPALLLFHALVLGQPLGPDDVATAILPLITQAAPALPRRPPDGTPEAVA